MKEIQLTQGQVAMVDDKDFEWLSQWKWFAAWCPDTRSFYARRYPGIIMHRVIMNTQKGIDVDHINHNTLDNRRENLRNVTRQQNTMNKKWAQTNNILGVLGVQKKGSGFRARIRINGKLKNFPTRKTVEEAIADRKQAEKDFFGEYRNQD